MSQPGQTVGTRPETSPPSASGPPLGEPAAARPALNLPPVPPDEAELQQRRELRRHRMLATGLLLAMALVFLATRLVPEPALWVRLVRAGAEAALVGGLADWFAVTALFRHPFGIPIPHTALVPRNKDRIGDGLATFVERNFLAPDLVAQKLRAVDVASKLSRWMSQRRNAELVAGRAIAAVPYLLSAVQDRDVRLFVQRALHEQLAAIDLAPILGRVLRVLTESRQHQMLFDKAVDIARRLLLENEDRIYEMVERRSRWWMPKSVDRTIARQMVGGVAEMLDSFSSPDNEARQRFDVAMAELIERLETDPALRARIEAIKAEVLGSPTVQEYLGGVWDEVRRMVLEDVASDSSRLRRGLTDGVRSFGHALANDPSMKARLNRRVEIFVTDFVVPWRVEIGSLIRDVVRSWDARTVTDRLELAVGPDLQFIRVNGTLVGALVGCVLFLASELLGAPAF